MVVKEEVKQRLDKSEQRNDQLFGKIESIYDAYGTLQSTIGEINVRLPQIAQAVEKMSGLAEKKVYKCLKRAGYFVIIIISMFSILVGLVIWYIQKIGA